MNEEKSLSIQEDKNEIIKLDVTDEQNTLDDFEFREPEDVKNEFKGHNINTKKPAYKSPTEDEFNTSNEYKNTNDDRFEEYTATKRSRSLKEKFWDSSKNISDNLWSFTKFILILCVLGPIVLCVGLPILIIIPTLIVAAIAVLGTVGAAGIVVAGSSVVSFSVVPVHISILLFLGGTLVTLGCGGLAIAICVGIAKKLYQLVRRG
ncbi:hypothetical protein AN644_03620 [Candidatus Epulonipiscium fishelsonii]|nr:hypothetical protein AN644_03620 [Epulopiscium sp. SCG-C06WGA-EpuloA1]